MTALSRDRSADGVTYFPVWKRGYGYDFVACSVRHYGGSPFSFRVQCTMCGTIGGFGTRQTATTLARLHEADHA